MAHQRTKVHIQTTRPEKDLQLIQKIGSGTYGHVFKAHVKATGALAAVKIISIEPSDDFDTIQQEIAIMQGCNHANIVQYCGSYLRSNKLWIAMEYCGGGSLQDIYHITGGLTEPMISFTCHETLKGLQYMHQQKKLHRDIKGANILLTTEGDVKLADFGVGAQINKTMGKRCSFIGTPYWMAPEVASVEKTGTGYNHLCDIWAVGITAIELAECQPPLFDLHPMRALHLIAKKNYTPPTLKTKGKTKWSSHFKDFLKQCLTKNPKKRPGSDKLLNHAFCSIGNRIYLKDLLDRFEILTKDKHSPQEYASEDEEDVIVQPEDKSEKPTLKRIQSRREKGGSKQPNAPIYPCIEQELNLSGNNQGTLLDEGFMAADIEEDTKQRTVIVTDTGTIKFQTIPNNIPPPPTAIPTKPPSRPPPPSIPPPFHHAKGQVPPPIPPPFQQLKDQVTPIPPPVHRTKDRVIPSIPPPPVHQTKDQVATPIPAPFYQMKDQVALSIPPLANQTKGQVAPSIPPPPVRQAKDQVAPSVPPPPIQQTRDQVAPIPPRPVRQTKDQVAPSVPPPPVRQTPACVDPNNSKDQEASSPISLPPSHNTLAGSDPNDSKDHGVLPPVPLRDNGTSNPPTLSDKSFANPPPIPPRLSGTGKKPADNNSESLSQIFTQKPTKNCFTKIFNECPLDISQATVWEHPDTKAKYLLFASCVGIYSLNLVDISNIEMVQIFARSCKWVYVFKNILISICGKDSQVYMHNLITLHEEKKDNIERYIPTSKGVGKTTKIPGTANTLKCCIAHNPYNNETYLYVGREDGIIMLQWYEPFQKFMIVKRIDCNLSPVLTIFEPIVEKDGDAVNTSICVGVNSMDCGNFVFDKISLETEAIRESEQKYKQIDVRSLSQLEPDLIMIAFDKTVRFVDVSGRPVKSGGMEMQLHFDYDIENAICLPGSVLTFHRHGVQGKALRNNEETAHFQDKARLYVLLCFDKIVVIKNSLASENHSNLYILANE